MTIYASSIKVEPNSVISPDIEIVAVEDILEQLPNEYYEIN